MYNLKGSGLRSVVLALLVVAALVSFSGCGRMEITEQVRVPLSGVSTEATRSPVEHDLAILAIDFNPPLSYKDLWAERRQVTLLVAVENRGLSQERNVQVHARLSEPRTSEILSKQSTTLSSLAPGEVQVARFSGISDVPLRSAYRLEVEVSAAQGERYLTSNARVYDLTIKEPVQAPTDEFISPLN